MIKWQDVLTRGETAWKDEYTPALGTGLRTLPDMLRFLDSVHIRMCLAKPYADNPSYPLVEPRELLPTFDNPMYEIVNNEATPTLISLQAAPVQYAVPLQIPPSPDEYFHLF